MKKLLILFFSILSFVSHSTETAKSIYEKYSDKIVFIESINGVGTGFELEPGLFVTNRHVVFGYDEKSGKWNAPKKLILKNRQEISSYRVLVCSVRVDICFIVTDLTAIKSKQLKLTDRKLQPGEDVFVIGHPSGVGSPIISTGIISSEHSMIAWDDAYEKETQFLGFTTNAAISQGSSGSPLISKNGELLGIIVGYLKNSQNLNLVISTIEMNKFIGQLKLMKKDEVMVFRMGYEDKFEKATKEFLTQNSVTDRYSSNDQKVVSPQSDDDPKNKLFKNENTNSAEKNLISTDSVQPSPSELMDIRVTIRDNMHNFKKCYQDDLNLLKNNDNAFNDQIFLKFKVNSIGIPFDISITSNATPSFSLMKCISATVENMKFSNIRVGVTVDVSQPFRFNPRKKEI